MMDEKYIRKYNYSKEYEPDFRIVEQKYLCAKKC